MMWDVMFLLVAVLGAAAAPCAALDGRVAVPATAGTLPALPTLPAAAPLEGLNQTREAILQSGSGVDAEGFAAVFQRDAGAYERLARARQTPVAFYSQMAGVYDSLRTGFAADLPVDVRMKVARALQAATADFLARVASDGNVPDEVRRMAGETREKYLAGDELLAAMAWERQQRARIAQARERFGPELKTVKGKWGPATTEDEPWRPPRPRDQKPKIAKAGVKRSVIDMPRVARAFQSAQARFESARNRRDAAAAVPLSPAASAAGAKRFRKATRAFARALKSHEGDVDYAMHVGLMTTFARQPPGGGPPVAEKGVAFSRRGDVYFVAASFQTRISDPAVLAAFRRSIENYWNGFFVENGRRRKFVTRVDIQVLAPGQRRSPEALWLGDGGSVSTSNTGVIYLARSFPFSMPAHEFGHILGLGEDYVNEYDPGRMVFVQKQDRSNVMASSEGLVQPAHFARVVTLNRERFADR